MAGIIDTHIVTQVGFIVKDIEKTKKKFAEFLGVPEPEAAVAGDYAITQTEVNGQPAPDANSLLAFFTVGESLQIELIQPNGVKSTWQDYLDEHGEGIHHIAFFVKGMEEKIAACEGFGMKLAQKGNYGDGSGRYAYMDGTEDLKCIIELLENF
jgi:catechol 2,3-dioxygenase-like lactoylglutathione lyase family enzyme